MWAGMETRRMVVVALLVLLRGGAAATWVVDEQGACVWSWTPAAMARGPAAMLNALTVPVRSAVGGVIVAHETPKHGLVSQILMPPLLAVAGGAMGLAEGVIWFATGVADTLTGGALAVAPNDATELTLAPRRPLFATPSSSDTDRCGRSLR
jgi:hypothetical protein